jgi:T4-like virus tail tube protein gp19
MPEASDRSYSAGRTLLELDRQNAGFVKSFEGGAVAAEVVEEPAGATPFIKKHLGQPRYEDIILSLPFSMSSPVYEWIADSWEMTNQRKDGSLTACNYKLQATSKLGFFDALITETTIPACDAASKEAAYLRLKITPESLSFSKASGNVGGISKFEYKGWIPSAFKLTIEGVDCSKVSKIDSFTVKQTVLFDEFGEEREITKTPAQVEFPNLRVTLSESGAQSWLDWHEDFVIKGNNDDTKEKNGRLSFLTPTLKDELAAIKLFNLGIFRIAPEKSEATKDQLKRVTADLYCERMELEYPQTI